MHNPKTIGFVVAFNPFENRRVWSGTFFKIREAIELAGYRVVWVPVRRTLLYRIIAKLFQLRYSVGSAYDYMNFLVRLRAMSVKSSDLGQCDYLFFPGDCQLTRYLKTSQPIIYYTDATLRLMLNYYYYFNQPAKVIRQAEENEQIACRNSTIILRASQWAADSVVRDYHISPSKVHVLEFGANLDEKDIVPVTPYSGEGTLNVLFSGVDWNRKGAAVAIDAVRTLNERGISARLLLAGIREVPADYANLPFVDYLGFMDKNDPEQYARYISIVRKSHLLLLPTKAECAGIVFCEVSAFGIPIFTYNTGGVGNYVLDGVNGYKLPLGVKGTQFADAIEHSLRTGEFPALSEGGKKLYAERLSWSAWARTFRRIMEENHL